MKQLTIMLGPQRTLKAIFRFGNGIQNNYNVNIIMYGSGRRGDGDNVKGIVWGYGGRWVNHKTTEPKHYTSDIVSL